MPVMSLDGEKLFFSELSKDGFYDVWYAIQNKRGEWSAKQKVDDLNLDTPGDKFVFSQVDNDLLLVNGQFKKIGQNWIQSNGLSWYVISEKRFLPLQIRSFYPNIKDRMIQVFIHTSSKTMLLSFTKNNHKDIYISRPDNPENEWTEIVWSKPEKIPFPLNSQFDEISPFVDADGKTLYFASNRPGGFGHEDIYRSERLDNTWLNWSVPQNMGFRINTELSEHSYHIFPTSRVAFFVSNEHSLGSDDIFSFHNFSLNQIDNSVQVPKAEKNAESDVKIKKPSENKNQDLNAEFMSQELNKKAYKPNNLVFLIDRSGSMKNEDKMTLVNESLKILIRELRDIDKITILSFANTAVLHYTTENQIHKDSLYQIIENFEGSGSTKANKGLQMAFKYVDQNFTKNGNNEIFLLTDGHFELSENDKRILETHPDIILSIVGIGTDVKALAELRRLADISKGSYINIRRQYIDTQALLEEVKDRSKY
jgi:Mg-chelatase subunit ChlD